MMARIDPAWIITVNVPPGSAYPRRRPPIKRWAVEDTGRNSVRPCTTPSSAALRRAGTSRYDARAFRCGLDLRVGCCAGGALAAGAGAWAAARVGALPLQKLTIAAAMNTLE